MVFDADVFINPDEFGQYVTFDNGSDPAVVVAAVVDHDLIGRYHAGCAVIYVKEGDLPAAPEYRDQFIVAGTSWRVIRDSKSGPGAILEHGMWSIKIVKDERFTGWT